MSQLLVDDRYLVLGLPAVFADLRNVANGNAQQPHMYKQAVAKLIQLMWCEGTALQELIDYAYTYTLFPNFANDLKQLTVEIYNQFTEQHPNAFPICTACVKATDQAEVCCSMQSCCFSPLLFAAFSVAEFWRSDHS